ncbi:Hypothetical Protein FCC1311_071352 [Hondaea fermentalgiana]|uniref:Uncharacterized protein n=1 Tax=Hondaea fermentalgiana TaxID=2315210 RepID=A0A2R5GSQ8_9STRA|nr:Hypothetical Protein FCC1311_071352 [Hondaea fermentalgiana]|eukprot:GBG30914.1 Hypothetical Protein FCC1311_071352 [Hondaea fermentalgiana]
MSKLRVWMALYLVSGVAQPLLMDKVKYLGATSDWPPTLLPLLAHCIGMFAVRNVAQALVAFNVVDASLGKPSNVADDGKEGFRPLPRRQLAIATCIDVSSGMLTSSGLLLVGSGVYTVIYSSTTAWTAVLSWLLGQELLSGQWLGIAFVTLGLIMNGLGVLDAAGSASQAEAMHIFIGVVCVLVGTVLHAAAYVYNERVIKRSRVSPFELCSQVGGVETALILGYNLALTFVYDFNTLYVDAVADKGASYASVALAYSALVAVNSLHSLSFFAMLGQLGAVTTGVLKSLLAVSVFFFAAVLFCDKQATQCFSSFKAASMLVVLFGSAVFRMASEQAKELERAK